MPRVAASLKKKHLKRNCKKKIERLLLLVRLTEKQFRGKYNDPLMQIAIVQFAAATLRRRNVKI